MLLISWIIWVGYLLFSSFSFFKRSLIMLFIEDCYEICEMRFIKFLVESLVYNINVKSFSFFFVCKYIYIDY